MVFEKIRKFFSADKPEEEYEIHEVSLSDLKREIEDREKELKSQAKVDLKDPLNEVNDSIEDIQDLINELEEAEPSDEVHPRIYKSVMEEKRLLVKKTRNALKKLDVPSSMNLKRIKEFSQSLARSINILGDASTSHRARTATLFDDRVDRLRGLLDDLQDAAKDLNSILDSINSEINELNRLTDIIQERENALSKKASIEKEITSLENRLNEEENKLDKNGNSLKGLEMSDEFKSLREEIQEINSIESRLKTLQDSINSRISGISRPLRKMQRMIQREEYATSSDVFKALNSYLDDPFKAAENEDEGLPGLNSLLEELQDLMEEKMKLDEREREKKSETVNQLLENDTISRILDEYERERNRLKELKELKRKSSLLDRKKELEMNIEETRENIDSIKSELDEAEEELEDIKGVINDKSRELEEQARSVLDVKIKFD